MFTVSIIAGVAISIAMRISLNQRRRKTVTEAKKVATATPQLTMKGAN